jgi:hypothetical protein
MRRLIALGAGRARWMQCGPAVRSRHLLILVAAMLLGVLAPSRTATAEGAPEPAAAPALERLTLEQAFVKTFKRDYVYLERLDDAVSVMRQLPNWFEHYNEVRPHRGLKMRSPREFRRLHSAS